MTEMTSGLMNAEVSGAHASLEATPSKQLAMVHKTIVNALLLSLT